MYRFGLLRGLEFVHHPRPRFWNFDPGEGAFLMGTSTCWNVQAHVPQSVAAQRVAVHVPQRVANACWTQNFATKARQILLAAPQVGIQLRRVAYLRIAKSTARCANVGAHACRLLWHPKMQILRRRSAAHLNRGKVEIIFLYRGGIQNISPYQKSKLLKYRP